MVTLYALKHSDDYRVSNGLQMDRITFEVMKSLNLRCFRSTGNRETDRQKAAMLYRDKVNLTDYAVHHTFRGLVGLVPRQFHSSVHHFGYFWRIAN